MTFLPVMVIKNLETHIMDKKASASPENGATTLTITTLSVMGFLQHTASTTQY
jgi:hypothetical protein